MNTSLMRCLYCEGIGCAICQGTGKLTPQAAKSKQVVDTIVQEHKAKEQTELERLRVDNKVMKEALETIASGSTGWVSYTPIDDLTKTEQLSEIYAKFAKHVLNNC